MKDFLSKLRKDYSLMGLEEEQMHADPVSQFEIWLVDAANASVAEPNAMTLSTVGKDLRPHSRIVLLRNVDAHGFVFYTNYESAKAQHIAENPQVALNFFWADIERQVRIEGMIEKIGIVESAEYFRSRPRTNQLSAWASPQSRVVAGREALESSVKAVEEKFKNLEIIEKPPFWGGYCVRPLSVEFWQGRPGRLHDRIKYILQQDKTWRMERLAP